MVDSISKECIWRFSIFSVALESSEWPSFSDLADGFKSGLELPLKSYCVTEDESCDDCSSPMDAACA